MGSVRQVRPFLIIFLLGCLLLTFLWQAFRASSVEEVGEELRFERERNKRLLSRLHQLEERVRLASGRASRRLSNLPTIIAITPTYTRLTQKADLTRLAQTLLHVPNFHWIVVEDSEEKTDLVGRFLQSCGVTYTHLNIATPPSMQLVSGQPRWKKHRGVEQRNIALRWLVDHHRDIVDSSGAVVYLMDDDNTYGLQLFDEMRHTERVSVWPVGLSGGLRWEGPLCHDGKVNSFYAAWQPQRLFPIDMAGFAFNLRLLLDHPEAKIDPDSPIGYLETSLLEGMKVTREDLEPRASNCRKVYVWHTRTEKPKMKQEDKLHRKGQQSDPSVET